MDVIADVAMTDGIVDGDALFIEGARLGGICARVGPVVVAVIGADEGLIEEVASVAEIDAAANDILAPLDVPRKDCEDDIVPVTIRKATKKESCSDMFELYLL